MNLHTASFIYLDKFKKACGKCNTIRGLLTATRSRRDLGTHPLVINGPNDHGSLLYCSLLSMGRGRSLMSIRSS